MKTCMSRNLDVSLSMVVAFMSLSVTCPAVAANKSNAKANGKATIYSDKFAGKKTATGETYKPHEMTAASNKLPLGSKVEVKNKKTGKKAVVKITDRMSKHSSAVVDLSKGAANKIGVNGTGQVQTSVVKSKK
jgi:rare lipoprotein A